MSAHATAAGFSRREQLREFLFSRRARLTPADVGMADIGRRRTPGLRREEVAVLAGVGVSWYTWLEQGRDINVSPEVLDSIARALRLTEIERVHLYVLAGLRPPRSATHARESIPDAIRRLVAAWDPHPAILNDRYWNILDLNDAARAVFNLGDEDHNCLISFFTNGAYREVHDQWSQVAPEVVASFRADTAHLVEDAEVARIVELLSRTSPEFAAIWARHEVAEHTHIIKSVQHPRSGRREFDATTLLVADRPDWHLVLYNPRPLSDATSALRGRRVVEPGSVA